LHAISGELTFRKGITATRIRAARPTDRPDAVATFHHDGYSWYLKRMTVAYLVTCYNKSQYIAGVLDAIIAERRSTDGDIIVIDDGSDDDSLDIIAARSTNQPNFSILRQDNAGVVNATNALLYRCAQPVFRLIDGDDIISPGSTAALLNTLHRSSLDIVFGAHQVYQGQPRIAGFTAQNLSYDELADPVMDAMRGNVFSVSSTLFRTASANRLFPLPERYRTSQDYMLSLRAALRGLRIGRVRDVVSIGPKTAPNRLSSDKRLIFGETVDFVASELQAADASIGRRAYTYALRRQSGRALLWSMRHGYRPQVKIAKLSITRLFAGVLTRDQVCRNLVWIARNVYGLKH
jgi:glycosyltransferase involved in cell wall biosynthesis